MLKRYDMKKILADRVMRRWLITRSTVIAMLREGVEITQKQSEDSYDSVLLEQRVGRVVRRRSAKP